MASSSALRRALLYVPATSQKMLLKSLSLSPDTLIYDLEDSVAPHLKSRARTALTDFLSPSAVPSPSSTAAFPSGRRPEIAIRINPTSTPHALADLSALLAHGAHNIDTIVVPKVESAADLHFVTDVLRQLLPDRHPSPSPSSPSPFPSSSSQSPSQSPSPSTPPPKPPIQILALIESALAITNLPTICTASPHLSGLIFAAEDFALSLSLTRTPSLTEFLFARQSLVTHASAHNLPSIIDLVHVAYARGDPDDVHDPAKVSLENECRHGKEMGFNGKQCIHPSQIPTVQRAFSPAAADVEWAVRIVVADEKAARMGRGAWTLGGKMVDVPVVGRARAVVERAGLCGVDVQALREVWKGQEPE